jgi:hypothetical protein
MLLVPAAGTGLWWLAERPLFLSILAGLVTITVVAAPIRPKNDN